MTLSRKSATRLLTWMGLLADTLWPRPPAPSPAALIYYESVLKERHA